MKCFIEDLISSEVTWVTKSFVALHSFVFICQVFGTNVLLLTIRDSFFLHFALTESEVFWNDSSNFQTWKVVTISFDYERKN